MFIAIARFLFYVWRFRSRLAAFRLARKGDVEGAINYIEREIESKGPSADRYITLGILFNWQGEWGKSLLALEEAEWLGCPQPECLTNKALALWKLGRLQLIKVGGGPGGSGLCRPNTSDHVRYASEVVSGRSFPITTAQDRTSHRVTSPLVT
jgi:hypothetical protein